MPSYIQGVGAPGVHAFVNAAQLARPSSPEGSDAFFAVGYSTWGPPNTAVTITGLADFARQFGPLHPNSHLASAMHLYFRAGGARAVVCRVVGPSAVAATLTVNDRAAQAQPTLRIDARYPSSTVDVRVSISAGDLPDTFRLTARSARLNVTEIYNNIKITLTPAEQDSIASGASALTTLEWINERSQLVRLTNLNSSSPAPTNLPADLAETTLPGGNDDFAGLTDAAFIGVDTGLTRTGLQVFNSEEFGTGQVAIPGITSQAAHLALIAHAERFKRFALLDPPLGSDKDDVLAARRLLDSSYAALYWPWIERYDLAGSGVRRFYPPSGAVAGIFARAEFEVGIHRAPANYQLPEILDVERAPNGSPQTDDGTRAVLNQNEVNVITPLPEQGVKVYGARVLRSYGRVTAVHEQRVLNFLYYNLKKAYRDLVFAPIDGEGRLFREARSLSEQILRLLYRSGALWSPTGREEDAFTVICDASNNPPESLSNHQLYVTIGVYIVGMAEMIFLDINNVPLATDLSALRT